MNSRNWGQLAHLVAGLLVTLHGVNEWDKAYGSPWFFIIPGGMMLLISFYYAPVSRKLGSASGLLFILEGLILTFTAFHYFELGKKALPLTYMLIAIIYAVAGLSLINGRKSIKLNRRK